MTSEFYRTKLAPTLNCTALKWAPAPKCAALTGGHDCSTVEKGNRVAKSVLVGRGFS